ncbi:MAG: AAA family ATPase, partial [bacterium]|nr:AAA family ATPase [bacterium]
IEAAENEYHLLGLIDSPHVVKAVEWLEDKNYTGLALENIQGKVLKEFIGKDTPFPVTQFLDLAVPITKGLMAVHRRNIIHRDINSANIIWNRQTDKLQIIDFDISVRFEAKVAHAGNPERLRGTLPYLSPEQTGRTNHRVDERSDLYSLGVTFYEMLTGRLPFTHSAPLEIVHAHLARVPEPPHLVQKDIPEVLSHMVLKLLAKNPEERYQSAEGLNYDLEKLRQMDIADPKETAAFTMGTKDFSGKLHIPETLYGREKEIKGLLEAYERVALGSCEMLLVKGYSGTGKTALVNEIHKSITKDRGYFVSSKFEQFQQNVPYFAFIQAINRFCDLLLTENREVLAQWKEGILAAVAPLGKVLTDIIPKLEHVIGKQPEVPYSEGLEAKNRFNYVFQRFIRAISTKDHPLVMFLDDLQWTDHASLELLKQLVTDSQNRYFLFIGAYRDNEVSRTHPLTATIEELKKQAVSIPSIPVKNLTKKDIREWLQATLRGATPPDAVAIKEFAGHIHKKTQGNAFF